MIKLNKVCLPDALIRRLDKLKGKVINKAPNMPHGEFKAGAQWNEYQKRACTYKQYLKASKLKARIKKIGFFVIHYKEKGNKEKGNEYIKDGFFVLPANLGFEYETRCFFFQNNALNLSIDIETHSDMYMKPKQTLNE